MSKSLIYKFIILAYAEDRILRTLETKYIRKNKPELNIHRSKRIIITGIRTPLLCWEGHFGAADSTPLIRRRRLGAVDSALDNSVPCRFGAGYFGAVSYFFFFE